IHDNNFRSISKESQIAALTAKIRELEKKLSKTKVNDSLETKRDSAVTIMFIAITIFVGFISAIYLSNNCLLSADNVSKIVAASVAGISLFGVLALGKILRSDVDQTGVDKKMNLTV
ncbi:hypothetical protein FRX31_023161, partial [Thalictrum thalictroides]